MSISSIHQYLAEVEKVKSFGGTPKETAVRTPFIHLLNEYAKSRELVLVTEISHKNRQGKVVTPDGTLKDRLRQDWGYWESKDEADDLDEEIAKKFAKGYPNDNILFEDSVTAVLFQNGAEVMRASLKDVDALDKLLVQFVTFERPEVKNFRTAIELFKSDVPKVTATLHEIILKAAQANEAFREAEAKFLDVCRSSINPAITVGEVREMMVQHILTEDIFKTIFEESDYHRENNVARQQDEVLATFFTRSKKAEALSSIKHYYGAIKAAAASIADHHEKQKFLKIVYETFYKSYNPRAADALGVVYTPNEIVRFMVESADYLLHRYFNKFLEDENVDILDPATGTGTFICEMIDFIRKEKLSYKYQHEMHANEVAILPYYISNLNIEYTYAQKMGKFEEFKNLCLVDTLDNIGFHYAGKQMDMFMSLENTRRIREQNERKISVIIGNPPYNANQQNENDNNQNRKYPEIDERIKNTFVKYSTAQKTKVYDMYARFYRWAFDRLDDNGIIAFVTNRSFIDSRTFDGFRKIIRQEFEAAYIIDTKSDVRSNPKISGTSHNVFGIQTGVAIMFLIKKRERKYDDCLIHYLSLDDFMRREQKLQWLSESKIWELPFSYIRPDKNENWINLPKQNDFDNLLPLMDKSVKLGGKNKALFELYTTGIVTARDEWVLDYDKVQLSKKIKYFIAHYNAQVVRNKNDNNSLDYTIKWSEALKSHLYRAERLKYDDSLIKDCLYRPFIKQKYYAEKKLSDRLTDNHYQIFGRDLKQQNVVMAISGTSISKPFSVLATNIPYCLDLLEKTQSIPYGRYIQKGGLVSNITDWGLQQFQEHYNDKTISRQQIFAYVYAVLHNPAYRTKYELNLKREFPRIPFYADFRRWSEWGSRLLDLHVKYEEVELYPLQLQSSAAFDDSSEQHAPKARLKADREAGIIILDEATSLRGIPPEAWQYKLGSRSALEWVLDQYRESKPKDATIAAEFDAYRFADYKEQVVDLLRRVCTVSVETMGILKLMELEEVGEVNEVRGS